MLKIKDNRTHSNVSKIRINSHLEEVWKTISKPGHLVLCHPFCAKHYEIKHDGMLLNDAIVYYNGLKLYRYFITWVEQEGYTLLIGKGTYASAKVIWKISPITKAQTELSIRIILYPNVALNNYPKFLRQLIGHFYFYPKMAAYVKAVTKGIKFYVETGTGVTKNQFGHNPLFSTQ